MVHVGDDGDIAEVFDHDAVLQAGARTLPCSRP
jgi:hydrogenase maturation factor HypE